MDEAAHSFPATYPGLYLFLLACVPASAMGLVGAHMAGDEHADLGAAAGLVLTFLAMPLVFVAVMILAGEMP